jgi:ParB family chromosome partitioning protein
VTNSSDPTRKALGRGLSSLIPQKAAPVQQLQNQTGSLSISIDEIQPNPLQPRSVFDPQRLAELAQSIRENGVIQPIIVRRVEDAYQLVAGERRWRAAKIAQLSHVPVVVQDFADERLMEITLIENIQREDLNPIEVAHAFERLNKEFGLSHDQIAQRTGKDRSTITNLLRLLKLPGDIQILLADHRLSMGHARALLGLPTPELQLEVAQRITSEGLSVRQVERLVQKMTEPREPKPAEEIQLDANTRAALQELERVLGTRVRIVPKSDNRGRIEIEYYSVEELTRIYELIVGGA